MQTAIKKLLTEIDSDEITILSHAIYRTRRLMGMTQYATAKFLKMKLSRLRNLEYGNYRRMLSEEELKKLSNFYGITIKNLKWYCQNEINEFKDKRNKIKCHLPNVQSAT